MARVVFTPTLQRHVSCPPQEVPGATVREILDGVFRLNPRVRGYVLDEQGALRKHMMIFLKDEQIHDRTHLSDSVPPGGEIYVMQALSGG